MTIEEIHKLFLAQPGAEETYPFGPEVAVYKVGGKMFALINAERTSINLKNDPSENEMLRMAVDGIEPGYHMNKRHWNTVHFEQVDDDLVKSLIEESYRIVFEKLTKKLREEISRI